MTILPGTSNLNIERPLDPYKVSPITYSKFFIPHTNGAYNSCLVASAAVIHKDRVLLLQRADHSFQRLLWELPGGRCEARDETVIASAVRELWEESGLIANRVVDLVTEYEWLDRGLPWKKITFLVVVEHEGDSPGQPLVKIDPNEQEGYVWATEDEVKADQCGDTALSWTSDDQKETVLQAFHVWRRTSNAAS